MKKFLLISILTVFVLAYFSFYTVDETEFVVVTQFGKPISTKNESGLYFKLPYQSLNYFDKRIEISETPAVQFLLKENKPIIISTFIAWRIKKPLLYFQTIGKLNSPVSKLVDMLNSSLGNMIGLYTSEELINTDVSKLKITTLKSSLKEKNNKESLDKYGIEILDVGFARIAYPAIVTKAVYGRMKAERETEAKRLRAIGRERAQFIRVEADKNAKKLLSEANKKAIIIRGKAEAKVLKLYGENYSKSFEYFDFIKSLETYQKILSEKTTLILSNKSRLFKFLEGSVE